MKKNKFHQRHIDKGSIARVVSRNEGTSFPIVDQKVGHAFVLAQLQSHCTHVFSSKVLSRSMVLLSFLSAMALTGCSGLFDRDEKLCLAKDMHVQQGSFLGNFSSENSNTSVLDVEGYTYVLGGKYVYGYPKDPTGETILIEGTSFQDILITEEDTILQDLYSFYRFHPSLGSAEQIHSLGWSRILSASVLPGKGIVYLADEFSGDEAVFYDFATDSDRVLFKLNELIPDISFPYGDIQTFMKDDSMHVLLAYSRGIDKDGTPCHLLDINLEKPEVVQRHVLMDHSAIRIVSFQDIRTIGIAADVNKEDYKRDLFLLNMETGQLDFRYRFYGSFDSDNYQVDGPYIMHLDFDGRDIPTARLVHWITGKTLITAKDSDESFYFGGRVSHIGEEHLVYCNGLSNKAYVIGRNNCVAHTLESNLNFRGILAAHPNYVIALMDDGVVEMFRLDQ